MAINETGHAEVDGSLNPEETDLGQIGAMLSHEKCVAVGEIGLDYHWNVHSHDEQKKWFEWQLELARRIGKPKAARAVGQAVGANPCLIVIPCHRVLAKTGLGGFACGLERKKTLLAIEGVL